MIYHAGFFVVLLLVLTVASVNAQQPGKQLKEKRFKALLNSQEDLINSLVSLTDYLWISLIC
jgi:hypothetical protein